ncbi:MAG: glycoside hydrolase family 130 protein [Acidobacteriota bacterium]
MAVSLKRKDIRFYPDPKRVITRFFMPGQDDRARSIIGKIIDMEEEEINILLNQVLRKFSKRHRNITQIFEQNFKNISYILVQMEYDQDQLSHKRKLLIGSYFTMEFSIESAAFFNPSVVEDPDQTGLENGQKRVIISFRATGEGHISSLVFRRGIIDNEGNITIKPVGNLVDVPEIIKRHVYEKKQFLKKLSEMHVHKDVINMVMDNLGDEFLYGELLGSIEKIKTDINMTHSKKSVIQAILWLANSHYEVTFSMDTGISERVLFPVSYTESNGIEDARFVRFTEDDGSISYYATYTAYNGFTIIPKLIETKDFYHFKTRPINGEFAQNKGMSMFPRKINGRYAMISRSDGVNNYITYSDNMNVWNQAKKIEEPKYPWEFVQIGNSGSPIETKKGWLLLTHGVGPVRQYSLGIALLDLKDPSKIIARLREPLLTPNEEEREGYVPNVVYSCGAMVHNNELIIPYAMSDYASTFASVSLDDIFEELLAK